MRETESKRDAQLQYNIYNFFTFWHVIPMIAKISVSIVVELGIHTSICAVYGNIHYVATYIIPKFIYGNKSI